MSAQANEVGGDPVLCPRCEGDTCSEHNGHGERCPGRLVHRDPSGEGPLHVWLRRDADLDLLVLKQGLDEIVVPAADWGRFVDELEAEYAG